MRLRLADGYNGIKQSLDYFISAYLIRFCFHTQEHTVSEYWEDAVLNVFWYYAVTVIKPSSYTGTVSGTYPLPEAQLDRFMLKLNINYPDGDTEREILALNDRECRQDVETQLQDMQVERTLDGLPSITPEELLMARREIMRVVIPDALIPYIINLTMCTRKPYNYGNQDLSRWISCGVSPRATIALANCARVRS